MVDTAEDDGDDLFSGRRFTQMSLGTTHVWHDPIKAAPPSSQPSTQQIYRSRVDEYNEKYQKTIASFREVHQPGRYASSAVVDLPPEDDDFSSDPLHGRTVGLAVRARPLSALRVHANGR